MTQRTSAEIAAELAIYRQARTKLINGERVVDVWRDGRRMRLAEASLDEINSAIDALEREYEQAEAAENGRPRRRPIYLGWRN
ncbi:gpW family protein [Caenibius sp. WL]|uniref:gpW family protein n=1 Tax=Caenibius sp. WL TaxID=2872646 RepID=UPI001C9A245F|nr:gpW family protein [Caenibius sp. WL]QZP06807.1 gpW family protein [Caenibius sp. WL]